MDHGGHHLDTAERVWPWPVQMGWDRGGWYSWDLLERNLERGG